MCWTKTKCLEGTESKSLHAAFTVPFYVLTRLKGARISLASAPIPHYLAGGGDRREKEGVWGGHAKGKGRLKGLNGCKGNKDVPCLWNGQVRVRLWRYYLWQHGQHQEDGQLGAFSAPWQAELHLQEGMTLLSSHQILQHCLHNSQTTGLARFPFKDHCNWIQTYGQMWWWLSAGDLEMNMHLHRLQIVRAGIL